MLPCIWGGVQSADAAANIGWTTTKVVLNSGVVKISGYFYNSGNSGGYAKELIVRNLTTTDNNDNFIWATTDLHFGKADASNDLRIYVSAGKREYYTFSYRNSNIPNRGNVRFDIYTRVIGSK